MQISIAACKLYGTWDSHKCIAEQSSVLRCYAFQSGLLTFPSVILPTFSGSSKLRKVFLKLFVPGCGGTIILSFVLFGPENGSIISFEILQLFLSCQSVTSNKKQNVWTEVFLETSNKIRRGFALLGERKRRLRPNRSLRTKWTLRSVQFVDVDNTARNSD